MVFIVEDEGTRTVCFRINAFVMVQAKIWKSVQEDTYRIWALLSLEVPQQLNSPWQPEININ